MSSKEQEAIKHAFFLPGQLLHLDNGLFIRLLKLTRKVVGALLFDSTKVYTVRAF